MDYKALIAHLQAQMQWYKNAGRDAVDLYYQLDCLAKVQAYREMIEWAQTYSQKSGCDVNCTPPPGAPNVP